MLSRLGVSLSPLAVAPHLCLDATTHPALALFTATHVYLLFVASPRTIHSFLLDAYGLLAPTDAHVLRKTEFVVIVNGVWAVMGFR
jgi:hypothetical protein